MIDSENFRNALQFIGFTSDVTESVYSFVFDTCTMKADFSSGTLFFPDGVKNRERNNHFDAPENFVVFECVHRLIAKGYDPKDIELEKEWRLGHEQKGGRADICVYDKGSDNVLMIIECKTAGKEYSNALKNTRTDGGQLFSYWQQEISAKWLVLYTSDLNNGEVTPTYLAISCGDDPNLLNRYKSGHDDITRLYQNAHTAEEKFIVWKETYNCDSNDSVIFSDDSAAYDIKRKPLRKRNLKPFTQEDKRGIVNAFEEILRHNNVSDKENAFNRLVALFICKLADEIGKGEGDELAFQYIAMRDSYEDLQDRLQQLYHDGMERFMKEEITYIAADYPKQIFANYKGSNRINAINDLLDAFRKLKYYTNNDFAFKDVHNEKLFYQNGKILAEVVNLFQPFRIVRENEADKKPGKEQLLGDLFEQLLDKGFKQNEGQFFTPIPIARFVWDALPLKRFDTWPKVIDYACGAGHFLTEAIEAVNYFIPSEGNSWARDCIYGVEKDYRLARVSKVSMFMNGAGDSSIIFGDGLENSESVKPGTFDILTANPPYSVLSFKQHLRLDNQKDFHLLNKISANGSEIEVLFVERIGQLLNDNGIAAVILPSSILSNNSQCYTGAREEILRTFKIRAIVKLGSKTFGATGTNTVIFFLERYLHHPPRTCHVGDSVDAIFEGRDLSDWEDEDILAGYLDHQGLTHEQWENFIHKRLDYGTMPEYFRAYLEAFGQENFYKSAFEVEQKKVCFYGLTYTQRTVVINAPSDNAGQKEFLGYDWSSKKGNEGIQYVEPRGGKMYVNADREAEGTLAHVVRQSFGDGDVVMTEDNARYARVVRLCDMLDFSRVSFNMSISLNVQKKYEIAGKYPIVKLGSVCKMNMSRSEVKDIPDDTVISFIDMASVSNEGKIIKKVDRTMGEVRKGGYTYFAEGDIIVAKITPCMENGKCGIAENLTNGIGFGSSEFHTFRCDDKVIARQYLFYYLNRDLIREFAAMAMTGASGHRRVPENFYLELHIPLPPMDIQQKIITECDEIDSRESSLNAKISSCREKIDDLFRNLEAMTGSVKLERAVIRITDRILTSNLRPSQYVTTDTMLQNCKGIREYENDLPVGSVIHFMPGDILLSNIRPYLRKLWLADFEGGCSPDVLVFRSQNEETFNGRYVYYAMRQESFFEYAMQDVKGLKMPRGKPEHILRYMIPDASREQQDGFLNEVSALEGKISEAMNELEGLSGSKESVLKKYLS